MHKPALVIGCVLACGLLPATALATSCIMVIDRSELANFASEEQDPLWVSQQLERAVRESLGEYAMIGEGVIVELQALGLSRVRLRHNYRGPATPPAQLDYQLKLAPGFAVGQEVLFYLRAPPPAPAPKPAPASSGDDELDELMISGTRIRRLDDCPALAYPLDSAQATVGWLRQFQNDALAPATLVLRARFADGKPRVGRMQVQLESLDGQNADQEIELSLAADPAENPGHTLNPGRYRVHWPHAGSPEPQCWSSYGTGCEVQIIAHSITRVEAEYQAPPELR